MLRKINLNMLKSSYLLSEYAISKLCGLQRMLHCYRIKIAVILKKLEKVKFDINKMFLVCNK